MDGLKLEGVAVHVNSTAKRGQALFTVAGRSVTSSDLVSGHKTSNEGMQNR